MYADASAWGLSRAAWGGGWSGDASGSATTIGDPVDQQERWGPTVREIKGWHQWPDAQRLKFLRELAEEYGRSPQLRQFVIDEVFPKYGAQPRDYRSQAAAILKFTQEQVRYYNEPNELIQSPMHTLKVKSGDCDDMAVLMAAMAHSVALPFRYVLAGKRGGARVRWAEPRPGVPGPKSPPWGSRFFHIYLDFGDRPFSPSQWTSAEPTLPVPLGYDVTRHGMPRGAQAPRAPQVVDLPELADATADAGGILSTVRALPWKEILVGVLQGVFTALALKFLMRAKK